VDPEFIQRYGDIYRRHWLWRAREELILETLSRLEPTGGWQRILDVGCGDGLFFDRLLQLGEVEGVEPAAEVVSADGPHRSRIHIGPFDESFRPGRRYRLVLMLDVLEHLADPAPALRRALELLEPGGTLLATVPAFNLLWISHDALSHHLRRYTRRSFRILAREAGLEIRAEHYFLHWVFAARLAIRMLEGLSRPAAEIPRVPPAWLNRTLYWATRLEQKALSPLCLPFGNSLLVVGGRPRDHLA
jgi:2-polyprenyl-3-methyl-5-hydroxy-6-metoxy-1,4-benzoquinol methylase